MYEAVVSEKTYPFTSMPPSLEEFREFLKNLTDEEAERLLTEMERIIEKRNIPVKKLSQIPVIA